MKYLIFFLLPLLSLRGLGYNFVIKGHPVHFDGFYGGASQARFDKPHSVENSHLHYQEGAVRAVISNYFTENEAVAFTVADLHMTVNWPENPKFHQKQFNDALFSLALVSRRPEGWLWLVDAGCRVDTKHFQFNHYALYFGTLWGQYQQTEHLTLHIGMTGHKGIKSHYVLPILGCEWTIKDKVELTAVIPIELSVAYLFTPRWNSALTYRGFGGRYRANHRVGADEPSPEAVFDLYSTGVDCGLNYRGDLLRFSVLGGWNFGGWIDIKDKEGEHAMYYKFLGAPYLGGNFSLTF